MTRDKVDILAGFGLTPNALAVAPVVGRGEDADGHHERGDVDHHDALAVHRARLDHAAAGHAPMAEWAAKNGIKRVFTLVSDYGPGIDAETTFVKAFKAAGGEIVDSVRTPLQNPDFAPFLQRIKDAKPGRGVRLPAGGQQAIAFMKGFEERGLKQAGIKLIATGDVTDDDVLEAMGDPALGLITTFHYSAAHDSPENKAFVKAYVEANGTKLRPNFMACAGYDGMAAIYEAVKKTGGAIDGDKFDGGDEGHEVDEPARPDHDRPGDARHRADRLHPQGREGRRQALQRRVRQVSRTSRIRASKRQGGGAIAVAGLGSDGQPRSASCSTASPTAACCSSSASACR